MTNPNLENEIIGLALVSTRDYRDLHAAGLKPEHFQNPRNAETWRIMQTLDARNEDITPWAVEAGRHEADKMVRNQITVVWLSDCHAAAPVGHVGTSYANLQKGVHDRHETMTALNRATQALTEGAPVRDVRLEAMTALQAVTDEQIGIVTAAQSLDETFKTFDEVSRFTPTPWPAMNRVISGWKPGALYVIGARPSVGKSLMLQAVALGLAERGPTVYESLEMSHSEIMVRLLAQTTGVHQNRMSGLREDGTSRLSPNDRVLLGEARSHIGSLPLMFPQGTRTVMDIRENARAARAKGPIAGIVIDYLQIMSGVRRTSDRVQEVSQITRDLKLLAVEFDCPVVVASQLNRGSVQDRQPPTLTALRESGSIEQDADVVVLLQPAWWDPSPSGELELDAIVAKQRQGPTAVVKMLRNGKTASIVEDTSKRPTLQESAADEKDHGKNKNQNPF